MSGIIFLKTKDLPAVKQFYLNEIGMEMWLEQENIALMKHGNLLLGMHHSGEIDRFGLITFFYETREEVDLMYERFQPRALSAPKVSEPYRIYNFFASDPEDRKLEFQAFLHPVGPFLDGKETLVGRRSIRRFLADEVPDEVLWRVFEVCRYSPTSKNSQSYSFVVTRDREKLAFLSGLRGPSTAAIARARAAVAVVTDPDKSLRPEQDGCIAAYHFILAARLFGLGTCWIAAMDRDDVKRCLDIPEQHHVATVMPLGWPGERKELPERRRTEAFVKFV